MTGEHSWRRTLTVNDVETSQSWCFVRPDANLETTTPVAQGWQQIPTAQAIVWTSTGFACSLASMRVGLFMPAGSQVCSQVAQSLYTPSATRCPNVVDVLPVQNFGEAYGRGAEAPAEVGHPDRRTFRSTLMLPRCKSDHDNARGGIHFS